MKRSPALGPLTLSAVLLMGLVSLPAAAQRSRLTPVRPADPAVAAPEMPGKSPIAIRRIHGLGRKGIVLTPQFQTSVARGAKPPREWGMVMVQYESAPEWIDELTVTFYAMSVINKDGKNAYSLYRRDVHYMDVARDRDHLADVYLRPSALERYGEIVAVAVEIQVKGEVVAELGETSMGAQIPAQWWKDPKVVKSEVVTPREGYMLNRMESPFGWINSDDYEAIK